MELKPYPFWLVFRETQPWPIRHIIRCDTQCDKETIKNDYYRTYYRFSDDCFRGFDKMDDALDFEQELKNASASESWNRRANDV